MITLLCLSLTLSGPPAPDGPPPTPEPPTPSAPSPAAVARALSRLPTRPTIVEVQRAALRRAPVSARAARRWVARSRAAAALPQVTAQVDVRTDQTWQLDQEAGSADQLSSDAAAVTGVRVRATWDLDRLVFDLDELRAVRAGLDLGDWRERLLVQVTQLFFERRRLLLAIALEGPAGSSQRLDDRARIGEIEALLLAMTGLDFSGPWPTNGTR